jgi:hypothetical protein
VAYLLYCIMEDFADRTLPQLRGVDGEKVFFVADHDLNAVVTAYNPGTSVDIAALMAYRDVINSFHRLYTVVPMRYGSVFDEQSRLLCFIRDHGEHYHGMLKRLNGLVEMGIRVLCDNTVAPSRDSGSAATCRDNGCSFLLKRKNHYQQMDEATEAQKEFIRHFQDSFSGLYKDCVVEQRLRLLSLYFLVPKSSVDGFQATFHRIKAGVVEKLLLSGPWPPYNFVAEQML